MKKYIIYIGVLAAGMVLGWLIFGSSSGQDQAMPTSDVTQVKQMWTCSMHPQIMQSEPGDCPLCGMALTPADSDSDGLTADQFKLTENAMALANVQTSIIGADHTENRTVELSGKIVENEESNTVQVSYFSGRIEHLNVSFTGEEIRAGQVLATIYSPELYAAQQELLTTASLKTSQPALYNAVRNKLKLWKLTDEQIDQIEASGNVNEYVQVYATVSGTVTEKLVEQGDYVSQGQALFKIANLNTVWGHFDVYENQIDFFKKGQNVTVTTTAYPNETFQGKVDFITPTLNAKTRTVTLRVVLNNTKGLFKPGMFLKGAIEGGQAASKESKLIIPASAILWTGTRSVVYVKTNSNEPVFQMKEVVLGHKIADSYEILEGLNGGDEIVTNGTFTVDAAAQLQGKKSMMNHVENHDDHHSMDPEHVMHNERLMVSVDFQNQLNAVFNDYIQLKDALVDDDSKNVIGYAQTMLKHLGHIDDSLLLDAKAHDQWTNLETELNHATNGIIATNDILLQRDHFKHLSLYLISAVETFGVNEKVFLQFCPMANNDKGGYWLSKEEQVLNPYFGESMLKCGEVKQVIE